MKFIFIFLSIIILSGISIFWWNNHKIGNKESTSIIEKGGLKYFELIGERKNLVHDPISALFPGHYRENILLSLTLFHNDTLLAKNINVQTGYYKYLGTVIKRDKELIVDLYYANSDDKKIEPSQWNGKYKILQE